MSRRLVVGIRAISQFFRLGDLEHILLFSGKRFGEAQHTVLRLEFVFDALALVEVGRGCRDTVNIQIEFEAFRKRRIVSPGRDRDLDRPSYGYDGGCDRITGQV